MEFVITLVASDPSKPLSAGHLAGIERFVDRAGLGQNGDPIWLCEHKAVDIIVSEKPNSEQIKEMRNALSTDKIDVFANAVKGRRKKLLLADMDSTIVTCETLDEMADLIGIHDKIAPITKRAMLGELDFAEALRERVALLKDQDEAILQTTLDQMELSKGAETLVKTMAAHEATCVLVSGGFTFFTNAIGEKAGFQHCYGNKLEIMDGKLTGTVKEPILDKDAKLAKLYFYSLALNIDFTQTLAIGDGANDLPMLAEAGLGVGYHPKPVLTENLDNCVIHGDLTAALYAQGYSSAEFAAA